jgi:acetylornithine deacetylase/succinyl-diaminopimelate desuccinylase-like protein
MWIPKSLKSLILISFLFFSATYNAAAQDAHLTAKAFTTENRYQIVADFKALLSLPNIATDDADMEENAAWISAYIKKRGFTANTVKAGGAPYIFGVRQGSADAPSILVYAHFDGQPVIPEDWASPPFTPTLWTDIPGTDGAKIIDFTSANLGPMTRLVARSAGDDKAPVIALMAAIDALVEAGEMPDITIKLILDGEEERGSPTLAGVLQQIKSDLAADVMLFCDGPMHQSRRRQLVLGVRGAMSVDLTTYGSNRPLHSGHYGNWAPNPNEILMRLLTSMKDDHGKPVVAGFLADVSPISPDERAAIDAMPNIDDQLERELGVKNRDGMGQRIEQLLMQPAIVVRGLYGGGVEGQGRNIIEPEAKASLNVRLVPGQTPDRVAEQLSAHFKAQGMTVATTAPIQGTDRATWLKMNVRPGGYRAFRTPVNTPIVQRLKNITDVLGSEETLITPTMGGSLPIYLFEDNLDMPIVILPVANHDNNQHGRNENIRLKNLYDAIELYAAILEGMASK